MSAWKRANKPSGWFLRRGEVCLIDLDKERPAVIVSSDSLNAHSLDICVLPISTAEHRAFSLRPRVKSGDGGLKHDSSLKYDLPTTVEKSLVIYPPLGSLSAATMQAIEHALEAALQLP